MDATPAPLGPPESPAHIQYIRISPKYSAEKQERLVEEFARALASCRGNQVWLAKWMDESDRLIRKQIAAARVLGFDIPLRALAILKARAIVPYLSVPPGSEPITHLPDIYAAAEARVLASSAVVTPPVASAKPAKKTAAKKKLAKKAPAKRGVSAKHPA